MARADLAVVMSLVSLEIIYRNKVGLGVLTGKSVVSSEEMTDQVLGNCDVHTFIYSRDYKMYFTLGSLLVFGHFLSPPQLELYT